MSMESAALYVYSQSTNLLEWTAFTIYVQNAMRPGLKDTRLDYVPYVDNYTKRKPSVYGATYKNQTKIEYMLFLWILVPSFNT
jgi:hypothetical protein